jgi:thioredoxin-like negative regulator of GroEL
MTSTPLSNQAERPMLVFFCSEVSGRCRRTESFLAQVLQRRGNHETFRLYRVPVETRPDLHERHGVDQVPTLAVVENKRMSHRLVKPRGCSDIQRFLAPWMR